MPSSISPLGVRVPIAIAMLALPHIVLAQARGLTCADVYQNAVIGIDIETTQRTERKFLFDLYCEKSGTIRDMSMDGSAKIGEMFGFEADKDFSQTSLKEFCEVGAQEDYSDGASFSYASHANNAALKSFNDCVALQEEDVLVTHRETPPSGFTVFVEFQGVTQNGTLDVVGYESDKMECSTQFTGDDEPRTLHGSMNLPIGTENISIDCARKSQSTPTGDFYPGAEFRMSTSWGPYTIKVAPNTQMGFDLISQAEAVYAAAVDDAEEARRDASALQRRLNNAIRRTNGMRLLTAYQGDNPHSFDNTFEELCPIQGGEQITRSYFIRACRSLNLDYVTNVRTSAISGGVCGHAWYGVLCAPPS